MPYASILLLKTKKKYRDRKWGLYKNYITEFLAFSSPHISPIKN